LKNKKGWDEAPWGAVGVEKMEGIPWNCFVFDFATRVFGNLKAKELEELMSDCHIMQADSRRDG